jgi:trehalose synthase
MIVPAQQGPTLADYERVAPPGQVDLLRRLASKVKGRSMVHVNSTRWGGGVAEMLHRLLPLMRELGVGVRWEVIEGDESFYATTKSFHNALQGTEQIVTDQMLEAYRVANRRNAETLDLDADLVLIHDPQPAALVLARSRRPQSSWVWRCHIDASRPVRRVWSFLREYVVKYDAAIFSLPTFAQRLPIPQFLVYPAIDPLDEKNRELPDDQIEGVLHRLSVPRDKPILLQVSRYDRFKDPIGVVNAYKLVKRHHDVRLVLAGGGASDDPEGAKVLSEVQAYSSGDPDIHVLVLPNTAHLEINALQRAATVVFQKSTKEGFGLTVAEALWKGKPVIGGAVGGIVKQIVQGVTGYLVSSVEGAAFRCRELLSDPERAARMGEAGREFVRHRFLVTRLVADDLALIAALTK